MDKLQKPKFDAGELVLRQILINEELGRMAITKGWPRPSKAEVFANNIAVAHANANETRHGMTDIEAAIAVDNAIVHATRAAEADHSV